MVAALIRPHPLSAREQATVPFPVGYSVADMVRIFWPDEAAQRHVVAFVGDVRVPCASWARVRPKEGAVVRLALTCFEGGGGGGKNILGMVAMIALSVVAMPAAMAIAGTTAATAGIGTYALAAGITLAGALAVQALFKPPPIDVGTPSANPADAPTYSITGQANQATPYGSMLRVYGRHRIFPRLAAVPFTTNEGPHQFLYMLLDCGYGPLQIDDLRIGDTPILRYRDVLYRIHPRWKAGDRLEYYRNDTAYEAMNVTLAQGVAETRMTSPDASGIVLDFALPRGLVVFNDRGERVAHSVSFDAYVRPAATGGAWQHVREYPVYVSRSTTPAPESTANIGAFLTYPWPPAEFIPGGATQVRLQYGGVQPGDRIYIASQHMANVTSVSTPPDQPGRVVTFSPPLPWDVDPAVQSPILRPTGVTPPVVIITDVTPSPIFFSLTVDVPPGSWEVQVIRRSAVSTSDRVMDELVWTSIRSLADRPPVAVQNPHTLIELKIRASEQLSGVLQDVNCIATSLLPVWTGSAWVEQATRNPAWAYADVLRGSAAMRPLADSRIDYADSLKRWADYCDATVPNGIDGALEPRVRFDHVVDYATTAYQLLQSIASAGRATPAVRDGKHGVIVDEEQTIAVQLFTPRNSWGFSARRNYLNEPHALRVKFIDPDNNWQEGNTVIYASGRDPVNSTTFEDLKLLGVTRYTQATRDARYLKAQALLRREEFTINCDLENLIATRGDLVSVQHDVLRVGGEASRIVAVEDNVIQLADPFGSLPAGSYGVRVRLPDGTVTGPIAATPIAPDRLDISVMPVPTPQPGDLAVWGYLETEAGEYLVKQIAPGDELTAQLTLAEVARAIYSADTGEIPPYKPPAAGRPNPGPGPAVLDLHVQQIDLTIGREPYADLILGWTQPEAGGYPKYRVVQISDDGVTTQVGETHLTRIELARALRLLDPAVTATPRTYGVIGVDAIGRQSEAAFVTFRPRDPLHIPGDAQFLASNVHDKTTTLTWKAPTDAAQPGNAQVMFFEVRFQPDGGAIWGTASRIVQLVPWNVTTVTVPSRNGAYLVKAITASGMESLLPAITVIAVEDLVIQDIFATHSFAPGWVGNFDHVEVDGSGGLRLTTEADGTFSPLGVFYPRAHEAFGDVLQLRMFSTLNVIGISNTAFMADWVPLALAAPLSNVQRTDWAATIWVAARENPPYMMADWIPLASAVPLDPLPPIFGDSDWRPLLHGEYIARDVRFAVVLESLTPNASPRVSQATVEIDFPEREERHADIVVPSAGLNFVFDRAFVFPPAIAIDLQSAALGDYIDRSAADREGFNLFIRNSAGAAKAGTVDIAAFGVGRAF